MAAGQLIFVGAVEISQISTATGGPIGGVVDDGTARRLAAVMRSLHFIPISVSCRVVAVGKPARFATSVQRAADVHELDLFPNAKVGDDGFSWQPGPEIVWRSIPHRV
jgi:hypothetical protein